MISETRVLPNRFRRALLYVVEALGEVGVTKLQKILYLADLEHFLENGTTLTGARWVRYTHGPMAKALLPSERAMDQHEIAVSIENTGPYESRVFRPGPRPRFRPDLSREERDVLDRVVGLTRDLTARESIRLAYNTAPMRLLLRLEEEAGQILLDRELTFELSDELLADIATSPSVADPAERAAFKGRELARIADLQSAVLSRAHP